MAYAVLGPRGTFSEEAANLYWGNRVELYAAGNIPELFALVDRGQVQGALVPIENSLAGSINPTIECLLSSSISIIGEISMPIKQCLLAAGRYRLEDIELLISQPAVLRQCNRFINQNLNQIRTEITDSTAKAAEIVKRETKKAASIGNRRTAELYNLDIIAPGIENDNNITRFIHISTETAENRGNKTSMFFTLPDRPGALYKTLEVFASRNLNLCKIESHPNRDKPGSYSFYIEIDTKNCNLKEVLDELKTCCNYVKCLGSY
jgi:prephenate dehydratase